MLLERKNYPQLDQPVGPYVHAVKYNGLLFLSGLTAFNTPAQQKDIAAQAEAIFAQIATIARAEQTGLEALLKVTVFVTSLAGIDRLREQMFKTYGTHLPASSLVQVAQLFSPDLQIEVEAILAVA